MTAPAFLWLTLRLTCFYDLRLEICPTNPTLLAVIYQALSCLPILSYPGLTLLAFGIRNNSIESLESVMTTKRIILPSQTPLAITVCTLHLCVRLRLEDQRGSSFFDCPFTSSRLVGSAPFLANTIIQNHEAHTSGCPMVHALIAYRKSRTDY
jgi:hypothetical protein